MEAAISLRLPARLTGTVTPPWLRTIQLLSMRQRPTISIKSLFLPPRQRVLVAQTERLRLISGDSRGYRRALFTFPATLTTSGPDSTGTPSDSAGGIAIRAKPPGRAGPCPLRHFPPRKPSKAWG